MSISLKEKLAELIFEYDKLRFHICPKIEDMYLLSFGFLECEAYNLDIELEMIKRYIELFNQGEDLSKIDEMLDNEFEESVGMLEKYMGELDLAIERKDTHFELSEDDLDSLNSLYLDLIYKLHPSFNPVQSIYEKDLFEEIVEAFETYDLTSMRSLAILIPEGKTIFEDDDVFIKSEEYTKLRSLLLAKKNIILQGAPGVGKTYSAKRLAYSIIGEEDRTKVEFIQFHQNYSYEDFVMGYKPKEDGGFELRRGVFYNFCRKAQSDSDKKYFFIIDEINRGNMSKIFGELLMLIENDYRGEKHKIRLAYNDEYFSVPENLYIIGMMNTADRSLAMIDYALRRRFSFFDMTPGFDSVGFKKYQENLDCEVFNKVIDAVKALNIEIAKDDSLGKGFCIGHSYFCNRESIDDMWLENVIEYDIAPMLREYWFDNDKKFKEETDKLLSLIK